MPNDKLTATEVLEREAGCDFDLAAAVQALEGDAQAVYENFRYCPEQVPTEWLAAVKLISESTSDLSIFDA